MNTENINTSPIEENVNQEELDKLNEKTYELAIEKFNSYNLNWTFRSINYVLNKCNISFGQLRSCVYINSEGQAYFDYIKSVVTLIKAGLIGSNQVKETDSNIEEKAYEIIEDWRENFGFIGTLHLFIINTMEEKNFFMGRADQAVMQVMSSKNIQKDLIKNLIMEDLEQKVKQAQALNS